MAGDGNMAISWSEGTPGGAKVVHAGSHLCVSAGIAVRAIPAAKPDPHQAKLLPSPTGQKIEGIAGHASGRVAVSERCLEPCIAILDARDGGTVLHRLVCPPPDTASDAGGSCARAPLVGYQDLAFSPSGALLFSIDAAPASRLCVWDVESGAIVAQHTLPVSGDYRLGTHPSSDSHFLVYSPALALLWEIESCQGLRTLISTEITLPGTENRPRSGMRRASFERNLSLKVDARDAPPAHVLSHAWTQDGTLYLGCQMGEILGVDDETGACTVAVRAYEHGKGSADALAAAGGVLYAAGSGGVLRGFAPGTGHFGLVSTTDLGLGVHACVALGPNELWLLGPTAALQVSAASSAEPTCAVLTRFHSQPVLAMGDVLLGGGKPHLASVSADGLVLVREAGSGRHVAARAVADVAITCACFASSADRAVLGTDSGFVRLLNLSAEAGVVVTHEVRLHRGPVERVAFDWAHNRLFSVAGGSLVVTALGAELAVVATARVSSGAGAVTDMVVAPPAPQAAVSRVALLCQAASSGEPVALAGTLINVVEVPHAPGPEHFAPDTPLCLHAAASSTAIHCPAQPDGIACTATTVFAVCGAGRVVFHAALDGSEPTAAVCSEVGHALAGPASIAVRDGPTIVTGGCDGRILSRRKGSAEDAHHQARVFSPLASGVALLSLASNGQRCFAAAADGCITCVSLTPGLPPISRPSTALDALPTTALRRPRPATGTLQQEVQTPTLLDAALKTRVDGKTEFAGQQDRLRAKIDQLRERLQAMIAANAEKEEQEQLDRQEFALDVEKKSQLMREREQAIAALREEIELEILAELFLRNLIKKECWDSMANVASTIYSFTAALEVSNYPLRRRSPAELAELKRVTAIRSVEKAEAAVMHKLLADEGAGTAAVAASEAHHQPEAAAGFPRQGSEATPAPPAEGVGEGGPSPGGGGGEEGEADHAPPAQDEEDEEEGDEEEDDGRILYTPQELTTLARKRNQVVLLSNEIFTAKERFNAEFDEVLDAKKQDMEKIREKNARARKICAELGTTQELFEPQLRTLEQPASQLEVQDDEVTVERVLTAEEQELKDEEDRLEAERLAAQLQDNPRERGVRDMMNGRLEGKSEDDVWNDLPKPAFLDEVPKDDWSDEQKEQAEQYALDYEELLQLRDKRRKSLTAELTKILESVAATCTHFDARLNELFEHKIDLEQAVTTEELRIMRLMQTIHNHEASRREEKQKVAQLQALRREQKQGASAVDEAKELVEQCKQEYDTLAAADKQLERSFKQRREFGDYEQFIDVLYKLYRKRPKRRGESVEVPELDRDLDCPEGLDDAPWARLVQLRAQKVESEAGVRAKATELAELNTFCQRRIALDDDLGRQMGELRDEVAGLRRARTHAALDVQAMVELKQGQVEITHLNDFEPDYNDGVLLHQSVVHGLNATVRKLAEAKVEHLRRRARSRKGIHIEEWENERLEMEKEDLLQLTKDIQLFRVSRNMMSGGHTSEEQRRFKEVETLQKTLLSTRKAHERALQNKTKILDGIRKKMKTKETSSGRLDQRVTGLLGRVNERATVHRVQQAAAPDNKAQRLAVVTKRRKLIDVVKSQNEDIALLREELDRLRRKNFPSFGPVH